MLVKIRKCFLVVGHVSSHHKTDGIAISCHVPVLIRSGQRAWGCCSLGEPCTLCSPPAVPGPVHSPLTPALGQAAQTPPWQSSRTSQQPGLQSSAHTGLVVQHISLDSTKCFVSGLKAGAQAQRHLFHISCAYECKHWSLKVIFTNVLPTAEFPGLLVL